MRTKTILLVEDNAADAKLTMRALERHKLANEIRLARDGAEAIDLLYGDDAPPLPEVVLLDLKLPRVDGLDVLRRIRSEKQTALLPVVVLTSSNEESDLMASYAGGANSYVRKPIDFEQFSEAALQLGLYWLLINEPPPVGDDERPG